MSTEEPGAGDEEPLLSLEEAEVHFEESQGLLDFSDPDVVRAVDGVSLDIFEQDVVALVGESGCGKTTLGKTCIGLQRPTARTSGTRRTGRATSRFPTRTSDAPSRSSTRTPVRR